MPQNEQRKKSKAKGRKIGRQNRSKSFLRWKANQPNVYRAALRATKSGGAVSLETWTRGALGRHPEMLVRQAARDAGRWLDRHVRIDGSWRAR